MLDLPLPMLLFSNRADHTAMASFTSEASLLAGTNLQPVMPALYFHGQQPGKVIRIRASGVFSVTGTPTWIFRVRLGSTAGSADLTGTVMGVTAAITAGSGVTSKRWDLELEMTARTAGIGTGNTTLAGSGRVLSDGFAAPYFYPLEPTTPDTATWTMTTDLAVQQYINLSATCSANSASNTITCKHLTVEGLN